MDKLFSSWLGRHALQFVIYAVFIGVAWGTSQSDINNLKQQQSNTADDTKQIKDAVNDMRVDSAIIKQKVETLEQQMRNWERKIDTLLWRTSPQNPNNQQ